MIIRFACNEVGAAGGTKVAFWLVDGEQSDDVSKHVKYSAANNDKPPHLGTMLDEDT